MFIEPDEYIIIMDMNWYRPTPLTLDEMVMLRDAGVRTIYFQAALCWDRMQPGPDMPLDWSVTDRFVEDARRAGLKMLIPFFYSMPPWKPDEWFYSRSTQGHAYGILNYDNEEMTAEFDEFMVETIRRYGGDDCQVVYAIPANGEFAVDLLSCSNMPYPMELFTDWVVGRQRILEAQHHEVWTAFHPVTNPVYWKPVYGALFSAFPMARHMGIIFTYVQHSVPCFFELLEHNQKCGMVYFGGTEYCQGIPEHVDKLIKGGMRMLTAPKHPFQTHTEIKPWMLDNIRQGIAKYAGQG